MAFGELGRLYYLYDLGEPAGAALANAAGLDPSRFEWAYLLGALHRKEGRFEEARQWLVRARELSPDDLPVRLRLGEVEIEAGRLESAEGLYRSVLEEEPESAAAWYGLGRIAYQRGEHEVAIERLLRALELQPAATSMHHLLGLAYRATGDLERARQHLAANRHGAVRFPDPLIDGLAALVRSAQFYLKAANRAAGRGRYHDARRMLLEAARIDPDDPLVRYNLGLVLVRLGDESAAAEQFERALAANPDYRNAHYNLAAVLTRRGEHAAAAAHFQRAVEIDPRDIEARRELLEALLRARRLTAASAALAELAATGEAEPEAVRDAHLRLAALFGQGGEFAAAAAEFAAAVRLGPEDEQARFGLAMALILGDEHRRARQELEAGLARLQHSVPLAHALARLLATSPDAEVRDGGRALALARSVFQAAPSFEHAETVGMALAESGDYAAAAEWQRQVVARAEQAGQAEIAQRARRRLEGYEQGRPSRAPWRDRG